MARHMYHGAELTKGIPCLFIRQLRFGWMSHPEKLVIALIAEENDKLSTL